MLRTLLRVAFLSLPFVFSTARADNWPQFRGPDSSGVSSEENLPDEWSTTKNVAWKVKVPGMAWSSPIVWGDRVFVTTAISEAEPEKPRKGLYIGGDRWLPRDSQHSWDVLCFNRDDGTLLWQKTAVKRKPTSAIHLKNTYASETPVTDGERVYAYFGSAGLYCFDMNGKRLWEKDLGTFTTRMGWGTASSPIVDDERLYLQCDNERLSFVVAFDKRTGDEVWREERTEATSWSTPYLWRTKTRDELVTCGSNRVRSYDPASGKLLWELGQHSMIFCPTPVASEELLYVSSGYVLDRRKPLYAIRPDSKGDITLDEDTQSNDAVAWLQRQAGPYNPSPILYNGRIYVLYDRGLMACFDAKTGREIYSKKRITGGGSGFSASPWAYDDKLFCLNEDGDTFVIAAGDEFELLGKNSLDEMCMASPAISAGRLFIRTIDQLYCIRRSDQ